MLLSDCVRNFKYAGFAVVSLMSSLSFSYGENEEAQLGSLYKPKVLPTDVVSQLSDEELFKVVYSPPVQNNTTNVLWGDTHLHTSLSVDAYLRGTRLTRDVAYRFAQGKVVTADNGLKAQLRRPLDFLAVADHASQLGILPRLAADDPLLKDWKVGQRWAKLMREGNIVSVGLEWADSMSTTPDPKYLNTPEVRQSIWRDVAEDSDKYNIPGLFTAFVAHEWTSAPDGNNLHRVVLFKDGADKASRQIPFSAQDGDDPEQLWAHLEKYEKTTGGEVIAIPHNSNGSGGEMFAPLRLNGSEMNAQYVAQRARWEPVVEVTQVKGDSETHPLVSPNDSFADFESWDEGNLGFTEASTPTHFQYGYARPALREGLRHESKLGTNPFKFGMIGSTDSHTGLATADEDNFFGKFGESLPDPTRYANQMFSVLQEGFWFGAQGLAAVWAKENTREEIFAAFKRREVYATTGPRITVRFFGGWDFGGKDIFAPDLAVIGYDKGVPMGSDLTTAPNGKSPTFLVSAVKDPLGANLDRMQIIKGWLDDAGATHEKIYEVALSDDRRPNQPIDNTVDLQTASYTNSIGATHFNRIWTDPDFDPSLSAFYYVRVLEIPTPRWTAYDEVKFKVAMPDIVPKIIQDRAYTSAIWYTP
jgi:hypothetical protein